MNHSWYYIAPCYIFVIPYLYMPGSLSLSGVHPQVLWPGLPNDGPGHHCNWSGRSHHSQHYTWKTSSLHIGAGCRWCVCAWDIWIDVKLLPNLQQGGSARLTDTAQRRHCQFVVIWGLINSTYLQFPFPISRQWQPAKPRTGTPIFCFTALLSQSAFLFDNWRVSFNLFSSSTGYGDGIFSILSWVLLPTLSCQV